MSGRYSRQICLRTPPKSMRPMRTSFSRKTSVILPGIARHMHNSRSECALGVEGGGHGQLAETESAVVGRHEPMPVNTKAIIREPRDRFRQEDNVHEDPAAE